MVKKIVLALLVLIACVLVFAATRPGTMHVERTAVIQMPAERIVPWITDFHAWNAWSPYEKLDPQMTKTFSGSASGVGSVYEWSGNSDVGQGRMEITDVTPSRITIKLDFLKPFEGHNVATFTLAPEGAATRVTWAMDGESPYVAKVMGIFIDMDNMIGKDFAAGLENLKAVAEK